MRTSICRAALLVACLSCFVAVPAYAGRPFEDTDLFSGHTLRPSSKDRKLAAGVNLHAAPMPYVARKALNVAADKVSSQYPGAKQLVDVLQHTDAAKIQQLAHSGSADAVRSQINADLKKNGFTPNADQQKAIDSISDSNVAAVADIATIAATPKNALVFGVEPWFEYNFGTYDLTAYLPLAGFQSPDGTELELGNVNFDFRAGSRKGYTAAFGYTGGLSLYLPSGSKRANQVALSNILVMPKYLHEYMTVQPYGIIGGELSILSMMARLEYTHMQAVRDNPLYSSVGYLNWGGSAVLHLWIVELVGEFDGLVDLYNAPAMKDMLVTVGGRLHAGPVRLGLGARMPITSQSSSLYARSLGTEFSNISKVNILLQGFFTW